MQLPGFQTSHSMQQSILGGFTSALPVGFPLQAQPTLAFPTLDDSTAIGLQQSSTITDFVSGQGNFSNQFVQQGFHQQQSAVQSAQTSHTLQQQSSDESDDFLNRINSVLGPLPSSGQSRSELEEEEEPQNR